MLVLCFLAASAHAIQVSGPFNNLEEDLVLRQTDEWFFGDAGDVKVDTTGAIYVGDEEQLHVKVFSPEGELIRTIGREGGGPGEFRSMESIDLRDGELYVLDRSSLRVIIFDAASGDPVHSFTFERSRTEAGAGWPTQILALGDDLVGIVYMTPATLQNMDIERTEFLVTYNRQGELVSEPLLSRHEDELLVREPKPGSIRSTPRPFGRQSLYRRGPAGTVYYCWTEELHIFRYDKISGKNRGFVTEVFRRAPVTQAQVDSVYNVYPDPDYLKEFGVPMHSHWPAVEDFLVDDQRRIWVLFRAGTQNMRNLWAFNQSGSFVKIIDHPMEGWIKHVANGMVYTLERDSGGREMIKRYRMVESLN